MKKMMKTICLDSVEEVMVSRVKQFAYNSFLPQLSQVFGCGIFGSHILKNFEIFSIVRISYETFNSG